jgi:hypothetical protein
MVTAAIAARRRCVDSKVQIARPENPRALNWHGKRAKKDDWTGFALWAYFYPNFTKNTIFSKQRESEKVLISYQHSSHSA